VRDFLCAPTGYGVLERIDKERLVVMAASTSAVVELAADLSWHGQAVVGWHPEVSWPR
jgi:hypothetical protein